VRHTRTGLYRPDGKFLIWYGTGGELNMGPHWTALRISQWALPIPAMRSILSVGRADSKEVVELVDSHRSDRTATGDPDRCKGRAPAARRYAFSCQLLS